MQTTISKIVLIILTVFILYTNSTAQTPLEVIQGNQYEQTVGEAVDYIIPFNTGIYDGLSFLLVGGDGGYAQAGADCRSEGGDGAVTKFKIYFGNEANQIPRGTKLRFIVGEAGVRNEVGGTSSARGGGGGGTAVLAYLDGAWEILGVAGGGGGAYQGNVFGACVDSQKGQGGRAGTSGGDGGGDVSGDGGTNGNGGEGGGDIGDGDLSGGGGGAFSDGTGGSCFEGKKGYPSGGNGGCGGPVEGGWGFGGGGGGDESPGGGGGYSGGGGGGLVNNAGGGGSYINGPFAIEPATIAGGNEEGSYNGYILYRFEQLCYSYIYDIDITVPICDADDKATVEVGWDTYYADCPKSDHYLAVTYLEDGQEIDVSSDIITNLEAGDYLFQVYGNDGFLYESQEFNIPSATSVEPVANCQDITVSLVDGVYSNPNLADLIDTGSADVCGDALTLFAAPTSFDCEDIGANTIFFSVTDSDGNSDFCFPSVTVLGSSTPPVAKCKPAFTVSLVDGEVTVSSIDNGSTPGSCGVGPTYQGPQTFDCSDIGANTVTLTLNDLIGQSSRCTTTVTIEDTEGPQLTCKSNGDIAPVSLDANGTATISYTAVATEAVDLCSNQVTWLGISPNSFDCSDVGQVDVTVSAQDGYGNVGTCVRTVTIQDIIGPTASCNNLTVFLDENASSSITIDQLDGGSTALCNFSLSASKTNFNCMNIGSTTVILTAIDENNATSTCNATVTVIDQIPPSATCKNATVNLNSEGSGSINISSVVTLLDDNCAVNGFQIVGNTSFSCDDIGEQSVTVNVSDQSGNTSTCTASVTITDNTAPNAICNDLTVQLDQNGNATITPQQVDNNSSDNCTVSNAALSQTSFDCNQLGTATTTLTVTDGNNHTSTCTANITVEDNLSPTAMCQPATIQLDATGNTSLTSEQVDNGSNDNCGINNLSVNPMDFNCFIGTTVVTLVATDNSNNFSICTAFVTVEDQIAPTANCNDLTIDLIDQNTYDLSSSDIDQIALGSADACFNVSYAITSGITSYDCNDVNNSYDVTLRVKDVSNNANFCTAAITIADPNSVCNAPPVAVCQDITVSAGANCEANLSDNAIDGGSYDPDGDPLTFTLLQEPTLAVGVHTITMEVSDEEYSSTCVASVTVEDTTPPVVVCQDATVSFNGEGSIAINMDDIWNEAASSDNCDEVYYIGQNISSVNCDQFGQTIPVLLTIEDGYGNESDCTAQVTVNGLPCNWTVDSSGLGCDPVTADYDSNTSSFSLTSEGCYNSGYYRPSDAQGFVQQTLCGDGQIIARVTEVTGNGWAGISMRESNDPSAPMIQVMIDGVSMSRRELRQTYGNYAFAHTYPTNGKNWLRISRSGNQFTASRSADGITWDHVFITQIPMSNCIEIGLITINGTASGQVSGTFENVSTNGGVGNNLQAPIDPTAEQSNHESMKPWNSETLKIYPNPATDEITLELDNNIDKAVQATIYNHLGQIVFTQKWDKLSYFREQINTSSFPAGTYMVTLQADEQIYTQKLVITRM